MVFLIIQEEKEELLKQVGELEGEMMHLKRRVLAREDSNGQTCAQVQVANNILRDTIQSQEIALARIQAMLSKRKVREQILDDQEPGPF